MAKTVVGVGDPKAVQKYSAFLAVDVGRKSYFTKKMMGVGEEAQKPLQILPHLENEAGDKISFDLCMQLKSQPIEGDTVLRGKEEDLKFASDSLYIDQLRHGINLGGAMTRKRTIHNMRRVGRVRESEYWARAFDELIMMYLAGARGVNADFIYPTSYTGFAGNGLAAPDTAHLLYGGDATAKNNIDSSDKFDMGLIERAQNKAQTMGGGTSGIPAIEPITVDGVERYVALIHPFQEYDVRTNASGDWLAAQRAAAGAEGRNNPIFQGALGLYADTIIHKHRAVVGFSDYGSGVNLPARRALFLGRQAGVLAFGSEGGEGLARFAWREEMEDRGNQVVLTTSTIVGIKKTRFTPPGSSTAYDFGVIAMDTYAIDPNP